MSNELKITKERVLKAAEKCSTAKDTLKELFPEAFKLPLLAKVMTEDGLTGYVVNNYGDGTYDVAIPFMKRTDIVRRDASVLTAEL